MCVWECVWTIWTDVKLLPWLAELLFLSGSLPWVFYQALIQSPFHLQGDHPCTVCDGPTKRAQYMRISRLITVTYLLNFPWWEEAQPKNLQVDFSFFKTKSFSFFSVPVRFSQSAASELINPSSKDVERAPSHSFSPPIIQACLSGLNEVFFARAMHSTSVIR